MVDTGNDCISLFQAQAQVRPRRGIPAFALSMIVHGGGALAISYAFLHFPVIQQPTSSRYKLRNLELHMPQIAAVRAAEALYPTPKRAPGQQKVNAKSQAKPDPTHELAKTPVKPASVLHLPEGGKARQTVVQPEIRTQEVTIQAPLPAVMIWTPALQQKPLITPPKPDSVTTADAQTSLELPNQEMELAQLPMQAVDRPSIVPMPPAGSTSPVKLKQNSDVHMAPATASTGAQQPTPAAVLSVSDIQLTDGTVSLPPVNETKGSTDTEGQDPARESTANLLVASNASGGGGSSVADAESKAPDNIANGETAEHIELPKTGQFGVVVVGSSLSDQYPETLGIWSDRVAYTAYLHVGTAKAWILQYSLLRATDMSAGGTVAHLEAPWPYDIVRPNLMSKDLNADALLIHGVLDTNGKLVNLAVAYPEGYIHASFVLRELAKWQFRPAQQLGKATPVEVLLIIPQEEN